MVATAVAEAERQEVKLPADDYISALKDAIQKMVYERKAINPNAPL